jgi:predicted protein tyrosine phosphatase
MQAKLRRSQMGYSVSEIVLPEGYALPNKIYLSGARAARSLNTLRQYKIHSILTMGSENSVNTIPWYKDKARYKLVGISDLNSSNMIQHLEGIFNFLDAAIPRGNLLVHCTLGKSRSPTAVISYLIKKFHLSSEAAFQIVSTSRDFIEPNPGFLKQLKDWEIHCKTDKNGLARISVLR